VLLGAFETMSSGPKDQLALRLRQPRTRYRPVHRIAVGGMAEVWRGEALLEGGETIPVAIKRVLPHMAEPIYRQMFEDEARLGMRLHHPNIVRVFDARDVGGTYIMIMELVDGDTLKGLLEAPLERGAPMPVGPALFIARELASALGYAHAAVDEEGRPLGIIHRDVSPHNLLLGKNGVVKLTDFGLADASVNAAGRGEGLVGGKLGYLAPEVVRQTGGDHRIDLFAVGITLWEMLAGRRLFQGRDDGETVRNVVRCEIPHLPSINAGVPEELDQVVRAIMHPEPDFRYQTGPEIVAALDALIEWLDPHVGEPDVALMTSVHLAWKAEQKPAAPVPIGLADLLAHELEAFQAQAAGEAGLGEESGAAPLDPMAFDGKYSWRKI
jgi:serine/threonine-protein kinase